MAVRVIITAVVLLALVGARGVLAWTVARYRRRPATDLLPADVRGQPGPFRLILAFSTPGCVLCQTAQAPSLESVVQRYPGRVVVRYVDAVAIPELANRFGIFTVPSTVLVDGAGSVLAINHGLAGPEKLVRQLGVIEGRWEPAGGGSEQPLN